VKLYVYTKKRSLPRLALKGLPDGAELDHFNRIQLTLDAMYGDDEPNDPNVMLEVDVDGLEPILEVDGEWAYHLLERGDVEEGDFNEWTDLERTASLFGFMVTNDVIPPNRITVLGELRPDFGEAENIPWESPPEELFPTVFRTAPKPLKAFKQPLVTRLLRSIFLPQHKLYGSGKRAVMGVRLVQVNA
jgi:hypothetical protein